MAIFDEIIGHRLVIEHLKNNIRHNKVSHCYIFYGPDGCGKREVAKAFAQMLLCEGDTSPCGTCTSCIQVSRDNSPDVRWVIHEKPQVFGVEDVREGLNRDIVIKPYRGTHKVYILDDAELLNVQAQNAILKTIEEPPSYAVIILLTNNREILLETIRSRSVMVDFKPLAKNQVAQYMQSHYEPSSERDFAIRYAGGNIGEAIKLLEDEKKRDMVRDVLDTLSGIFCMNMEGLMDALKKLADYKDVGHVCLNWMLLWYRDVSVCRFMAQELSPEQAEKYLYFPDYVLTLQRAAKAYTPQALGKILESISQTYGRLRANVNFELALEMLLLDMMKTADRG